MIPGELEHVFELVDHVLVVDVERDTGGRVEVGPFHVGGADVDELVAHHELGVAHPSVARIRSIRSEDVVPAWNLDESDVEGPFARAAVLALVLVADEVRVLEIPTPESRKHTHTHTRSRR